MASLIQGLVELFRALFDAEPEKTTDTRRENESVVEQPSAEEATRCVVRSLLPSFPLCSYMSVYSPSGCVGVRRQRVHEHQLRDVQRCV